MSHYKTQLIMKELTYISKIATLRLLNDILHADNIVHEGEIEYLKRITASFCLSEGYETDLNSLVTLQALSIIRELAPEQKEIIARLMGEMIVIDKDINYNEIKIYHAVCESCNIHGHFDVEDYPEYSLSGPFTNPEDLMNI